jgi:hypothetical protein
MIEGAGGAPLRPEIAHLFDAVRAVRSRPLAGLSGADLREEVIQLRRAGDLLELTFAETVGAHSASGDPLLADDGHSLSFLREECQMTSERAAEAVSVGDQALELGAAVAAVEAAEIGFAHLAVMARTREAISPLGRWKPELEARLLRKAKALTVTRFKRLCLHARHEADAEGFLLEQQDGVEGARLEISGGYSGSVWLRAVLPTEAGAVVRTALEALAGKRGPEDERKREVRLAHALVELCEHGMDGGLAPRRGGVRPHLQVTTTLETLLAQPGAPAGELEFSLPVSAKTVQRVACDCTVTRVLLDADSVVIDVGRGKRIVSPSGRRALHARDQHCQWPGCDRPGSWCTPHHLLSGASGGTSDLSNQLLLCWRHHWMVHEGEWQLVRSQDGRILTIPPVPIYCRGPGRPEAA